MMIRSELFRRITGLVLGYETGDFLLLSDLSDALAELKDFFLDTDEACQLIESLLKCVLDEMKKAGNADFAERLTEGIDLLQGLDEDLAVEQRADQIARISGFVCPDTRKGTRVDDDRPCRDDESLQIFMSEVSDRLDQAQSIILNLEENAGNLELVQNLFRIFHTIKGECGFLKIATLGELTHNMESLLDTLRSGKTEVLPPHIDLLLEGLDLSRKIVERLKDGDFVVLNDIAMDSYLDKLRKASSGDVSSLGNLLVSEGKMDEVDVVRVLQKQKETAYTKRFGEIAVKENYLTSEELQKTLERQRQNQPGGEARKAERIDPIIKVKASKVNFLVDMIGELLIAMGQMPENTPGLPQIRKITRSLQFGAMELRTDSVQTLFGNIKRIVRDLSKQLGKDIRLVTLGEDLEIDRNLIEKLEEPLVHMVRNSLDHGLGTPAERQAVGKDVQGTVSLNAERRGNSIVISVRDDGRGLSREHILPKAIERGLVREDAAEAMSDAQVYNLIFTPGFSTQDTVSQISGRGVGMGIVRTVVAENRGRIEIETEVGQYTEFRLVFPLSTAIIDGMIVRVGEGLFIFPIGSVIESLKIYPGLISTVNGRVEVANLRGESVPVLRMHELFDVPDADPDGIRIGVVIEDSNRRKFMMVLDEVIAKREVVIKTLGNRFRNMRGVSSVTVLSGGKIGLVVDVDQAIDLSLPERTS